MVGDQSEYDNISDEDVVIVDPSRNQELNEDQIADVYSKGESTEEQVDVIEVSNDQGTRWFTRKY